MTEIEKLGVTGFEPNDSQLIHVAHVDTVSESSCDPNLRERDANRRQSGK
jgi:hypothetical protein